MQASRGNVELRRVYITLPANHCCNDIAARHTNKLVWCGTQVKRGRTLREEITVATVLSKAADEVFVRANGKVMSLRPEQMIWERPEGFDQHDAEKNVVHDDNHAASLRGVLFRHGITSEMALGEVSYETVLSKGWMRRDVTRTRARLLLQTKRGGRLSIEDVMAYNAYIMLLEHAMLKAREELQRRYKLTTMMMNASRNRRGADGAAQASDTRIVLTCCGAQTRGERRRQSASTSACWSRSQYTTRTCEQ